MVCIFITARFYAMKARLHGGDKLLVIDIDHLINLQSVVV